MTLGPKLANPNHPPPPKPSHPPEFFIYFGPDILRLVLLRSSMFSMGFGRIFYFLSIRTHEPKTARLSDANHLQRGVSFAVSDMARIYYIRNIRRVLYRPCCDSWDLPSPIILHRDTFRLLYLYAADRPTGQIHCAPRWVDSSIYPHNAR